MLKNETGRSMVEMLGVLAIIGVLSVGGIAGYTMAMKKYKANEILNTISMLATVAHAQNGGEGLTSSGTDSSLTAASAGLTVISEANGTLTATYGDGGPDYYTITTGVTDDKIEANMKNASPVCSDISDGNSVEKTAKRIGWCLSA